MSGPATPATPARTASWQGRLKAAGTSASGLDSNEVRRRRDAQGENRPNDARRSRGWRIPLPTHIDRLHVEKSFAPQGWRQHIVMLSGFLKTSLLREVAKLIHNRRQCTNPGESDGNLQSE